VRALVLQHIGCEPPGAYEEVLDEQGVAITRVELDEGAELPDWRGFDAIVAMGGPMSVNDEVELPWLKDEKRLIAEAVRGGRPYWGVCLGAQLLAASLGARVWPGPAPEVGLLPVTLTGEGRADPILAGLPGELLTLQWHGDTFDLPPGSVLLATSPLYPAQAFRYGSLAYAVQFHLEVSAAMAREWAAIPAYAESLDRALGPGALRRLIGDLESAAPAINHHARTIFRRWLTAASQASPPAPV
jgi:GMP synthase-like glutamine amidotransferase